MALSRAARTSTALLRDILVVIGGDGKVARLQLWTHRDASGLDSATDLPRISQNFDFKNSNLVSMKKVVCDGTVNESRMFA